MVWCGAGGGAAVLRPRKKKKNWISAADKINWSLCITLDICIHLQMPVQDNVQAFLIPPAKKIMGVSPTTLFIFNCLCG
jgi:hypothetical protein